MKLFELQHETALEKDLSTFQIYGKCHLRPLARPCRVQQASKNQTDIDVLSILAAACGQMMCNVPHATYGNTNDCRTADLHSRPMIPLMHLRLSSFCAVCLTPVALRWQQKWKHSNFIAHPWDYCNELRLSSFWLRLHHYTHCPHLNAAMLQCLLIYGVSRLYVGRHWRRKSMEALSEAPWTRTLFAS